MKIVVFGTGLYFLNRQQTMHDHDIVAFIDNDKKKIGLEFCGKVVVSPNEIGSLDYEYVVLMSVSQKEMREQLLDLGVREDRVIHYTDFAAAFIKKHVELYIPEKHIFKKRILITYTILDKGGAAVAAINAARAIKSLGYDVTIACDIITEHTIEKLVSYEIGVIETTSIYGGYDALKEWVKDYDFHIANSIDMYPTALRTCQFVKTMLWIHDLPSRTESICQAVEASDYLNDRISVYAVSEISKQGFLRMFPGAKVELLPYGIPEEEIKSKTSDGRLIFALIGVLGSTKGQDILLDAIDLIPKEKLSEVEFWFVGQVGDQVSLKKRIDDTYAAYYKGFLKRGQMSDIYRQIDVVVSASRGDSLPTVLVEAMMARKTCITSDSTGIAPFLRTGIDGIVFPKENAYELAQKVIWCIENREELVRIGNAGYELYKKTFTMEVFYAHIAKVLAKELACEQ